MDHALLDGIAAVELLMSCLDKANGAGDQHQCNPFVKRKAPKIGCLRTARAVALGVIQGLLGPCLPADKRNTLKIPDHMHPGLRKSVKTTATVELHRIKDLREKYEGATVTDILLSIMTVCLRRYSHWGHDPPIALADPVCRRLKHRRLKRRRLNRTDGGRMTAKVTDEGRSVSNKNNNNRNQFVPGTGLGSGYGLVATVTNIGGGGPEAKKKFVYLKSTSNFGPL